jgi:multicomponent Na+:H+ antiporter subunit B
MPSMILSYATRTIMPILMLFAVFLLLRGHNLPGGGFVGGLIAASAFALYAISEGVGESRAVLRFDPQRMMGVGLLVSISAGLTGLFAGHEFFEGLWPGIKLPVIGKLGTPLLFDVGVFLVVIGFGLTVIYSLLED